MSSAGDPSTFTFTMDAMPDYTHFDKTKKVLAVLQVLEADDNHDGYFLSEDEKPTYQRKQYNVDTKGNYIGYTTKSGKNYKDTGDNIIKPALGE